MSASHSRHFSLGKNTQLPSQRRGGRGVAAWTPELFWTLLRKHTLSLPRIEP